MWVQQSEPRGFAARARARLDRYPVESNVIATWLQLELGGRPRPGSRWWLLFEDPDRPDELAGVAFQADGFALQLGPMSAEAADALAQHYAQSGLDPHGVSGVDESARDFAQAWQRATGAGYRATMTMRIYALSRVTEPEASGSARPADRDDLDLCQTWLTAFSSEALPDERRDTVRPMVERRVAAGQLWLWLDGGHPVSLAGVSPTVAGVARVGPVYTPPVFRRHGYGAAVTAAASRAALQAGAERCMLYTDLANSVSNSIYQGLGYRPVADAVRYTFSAAAQSRPTTPPRATEPTTAPRATPRARPGVPQQTPPPPATPSAGTPAAGSR